MLRLSDENANQGITQDDCQQLADFLSEAERDTNLSRFAPQAQKIFKNKCGASVEGDPLNSAPAAATDSAWDGVPQCGSQGGRVLFVSTIRKPAEAYLLWAVQRILKILPHLCARILKPLRGVPSIICRKSRTVASSPNSIGATRAHGQTFWE